MGDHSADAPCWARAAVTTQRNRLTKERREEIRARQLHKQEAEERAGSAGSPTPRWDSLVGLCFVQPNAADEGAHHAGDDDGEADPACFHLLPLQDTQHRGQRPLGAAYQD